MTHFGLYARIGRMLTAAFPALLLFGCSCDECEQELLEKKLALQQCQIEREDYLAQKTACVEELDLFTTGSVLSYDCAGTASTALLPDDARYETICTEDSSVTVTEGSIGLPDGMLIVLPNQTEDTRPGGSTVQLPGGGSVVFPGGGGVVFPGGGNVVYPGGGNVVFPGGGNVVFAPDDGGSSTGSTLDTVLKAFDVFVIENPENVDNNSDDGFLRLPGDKTWWRCVQDPRESNTQVYNLAHNVDGYTISCLKPSGGSVQSTLITAM